MKIRVTVNSRHPYTRIIAGIMEGIECQVECYKAISGLDDFKQFCSYVKKKIDTIISELGHVFLQPPGLLAYSSGEYCVNTSVDGKYMKIYVECKSNFRDQEPFEVFSFTITE